MISERWKSRPPGSNWGEFGPDDQLGRLNLLTPEKVRQGVAEVMEGITFCLSLPLDYPGGNRLNPRRHPPRLQPTVRGDRSNFNFPMADEQAGLTDVVCDDMALIFLQYSTQWDSLAHVGALFDADGDGTPETVFYNGYRAREHILGPEDTSTESDQNGPASSAIKLGIETMAATSVQGRAVLVDLHRHFGDERHIVGYDEFARILETDAVTVEPGDMMCLHTGFAELVLQMDRQPDIETLHNACTVLDGRDTQLLNWITDSGIAALIADNYAVEAYPAREAPTPCAALPLHQHCLFKLGLPLGELWHLTPLSRWLRQHRRSRFLLTAPPLRLPGAVGSPVTPVATV
jgi:kynurenine formamidase